MYITCPSCHTSFAIDEQQIGPSGRRVKCSSCKYLWLALPNAIRKNTKEFNEQLYSESKSSTLNYAPIPGVNLPVIVPDRTPLLAQLIILCTLVSLILLGIIAVSNQLSWHHIYSDTSNLTPQILSAKNTPDTQTTQIIYSIINNSDNKSLAPLARIRFFDDNQKIINEHIVNKSDFIIAAKERLTLQTNLPIETSFKSIDITLGDQIDFLLK